MAVKFPDQLQPTEVVAGYKPRHTAINPYVLLPSLLAADLGLVTLSPGQQIK
jgi:hypothetical protein